MSDDKYIFTGPTFYNFEKEASEGSSVSMLGKLVDDLTVDEFLGILERWDLGEPGDAWCGTIRQGAQFIRQKFPEGHQFKFAELGVFAGAYSEALLKYFPIEEAWFIDPWMSMKYSGYGYDQPCWNFVHEVAVQRIYSFPRTKVIRSVTSAAARMVPNGLDFIYIDGNHMYEYVKQDLEIWAEKITPGGWIWGDDFAYDGVEKAVVEFTKEKLVTEVYQQGSQWWFPKSWE